jgi:anti-anti-sigma factor
MTPIRPLSVTISRRRLRRFPRRDTARVVVRLRGEHDLSTVAVLSETMAWAIAHDEADVVVDLSDVQFMGATTVSVLIRARELLRTRSRSLLVRSPSRCARRVLELCGATDLLDPSDAAPLAGTADALATWVAVPGADRADRHADVPPPEPGGAPTPIRVSHVTAARATSAEADHRADELPVDVTGLGAP